MPARTDATTPADEKAPTAEAGGGIVADATSPPKAAKGAVPGKQLAAGVGADASSAGVPKSMQARTGSTSVKVPLAHHLDVDEDGYPAQMTGKPVVAALKPGATLEATPALAIQLINAGFAAVDPTDPAAVAKLLG